MKAMLFLLAFVVFLVSNTLAYFITIDANEEQCFFSRVKARTTIVIMFEVAEGGFLDIDVKITGPGGRIIYNAERESSGKYTFAADVDGVYTYCFSNKMSSLTPKEVMFTVDIIEPNDHHAENLAKMLAELANMLKVVKNEQEYMEVRDRVHRSINENTNSRVMIWALFEAAVLIAMTVGQVFYLKRFFEVQTIV